MDALKCQNCGRLIANVYPSYGFVSAEHHQHDLYMVRLSETDYRFFCTNCGAPTTWTTIALQVQDFGDFTLAIGASKEFSFRPFTKEWPFAEVLEFETILAGGFPSAGICECAVTFTSNIDRVNAIGQLAILVAGLQRLNTSTNLLMAHTKVMEKSLFGHDPGFDLESPHTADFVKWYLERAKLDEPSLSAELLEKINLSGQIAVASWRNVHPEIATGIDAIMRAQITLAWTAFEILSGDLWIAALNERPKPLATNFARGTQDKGQDKSIPISVLAKYGNHDFNLSASMGTVFAQQKKADFTSLQTTSLAFEKAFGRKLEFLNAPDLILLEKVRNIILHCGGLVDQAFMDELRHVKLHTDPDCAGLDVGVRFPINPNMSTRLVAASIDAGKALVKYVATMHRLSVSGDAQSD